MKDIRKTKMQLVQELEALRLQLDQARRSTELGAGCQDSHLLASALDYSPESIIITDMDGIIIYSNKAAASLVNESVDKFLETDIRHHLEDPKVVDKLIQAVRQEGCFEGEFTTRCIDGSELRVHSSNSIIYNEKSQAVGIVWIMKDITQQHLHRQELVDQHRELMELVEQRTVQFQAANANLQKEIEERKRAEKVLKQSEEKYRDVVENTSEGIVILQDGKVKFSNRRMLEMIGYRERDVINREYYQFVEPSGHKGLDNLVLSFKQGVNLPSHLTMKLRHRSGRIVLVELTISRMMFEESVAALIFVHDITTKKRMEEKMVQIHKLESLGLLAGGIAHDFNNILTAILGYINVIGSYASEDKRIQEVMKKAELASLQARDLTQQLLILSRTAEPVLTVTPLRELIRDTAGFALRGSRTKCYFNLPDDLWAVLADGGQVHQVICNLVSNASQAMGNEGRVDIEAENVELKAGNRINVSAGKYVHVMVRDQGPGIPPEHLTSVFDPYFTTKEKGSGLGLAITHSIIDKHSGHISIKSRRGTGTAVSFYLPATVKSKDDSEKFSEADTMCWGEGRILVMDDEESVRDVSGLMLTTLGFEPDFARDGLEALHSFIKAQQEGKPYRAVILDLSVPSGMGGLETVKKLKKINPDICYILSSGFVNDPTLARCTQFGFAGCIKKPIRLEDLSRLLYQLLVIGTKA